jgi:hypothetical protein
MVTLMKRFSSHEGIQIASQFFLTQMAHWAFFPLPLLVVGITAENSPILGVWAYMGLLPFILTIIRLKSNRFLPFTGLHLLAGLLFWFILPWNGILGIVLRIITVIYLFMSFILRVREGDRQFPPLPPPVAVGIAAFALLVQPHIAAAPVEDILFQLGIVIYFFCYFIWNYLVNYLRFIKVNSSSAGYLPAKEIFRSGVGAVGIYAAFGAGLLLLTGGLDWLTNLLKPVGNLFIHILRFLISLVGDQEAPVPIAESVPPAQEWVPDLGSDKPFWLWDILSKIMLWALLIAVFLLLLRGLFLLVRFLLQRFRSRINVMEEGLSEGIQDIREKCEPQSQSMKRTGWWANLLPGERIRRWYRKLLIQGSKKLKEDTSPETHTTKDWESLLQLGEITSIYEKARYSDQTCTQNDIKQWKSILKKLP